MTQAVHFLHSAVIFLCNVYIFLRSSNFFKFLFTFPTWKRESEPLGICKSSANYSSHSFLDNIVCFSLIAKLLFAGLSSLFTCLELCLIQVYLRDQFAFPGGKSSHHSPWGVRELYQ